MDTTILVDEIEKLRLAFSKEGKEVKCTSLRRAYADLSSSPYILSLVCPWTNNYTSCFAKTKEVVNMMYKVFSTQSLERIFSVNVFDSEEELQKYIESEGQDWTANYCTAQIQENTLVKSNLLLV